MIGWAWLREASWREVGAAGEGCEEGGREEGAEWGREKRQLQCLVSDSAQTLEESSVSMFQERK